MLITLKPIYHFFFSFLGNTIRRDNFTVSESMQNLRGGFSDFENLYWVGK